MHHLTNLTALNDQGGLYALTHRNQIMMHGTYSQQTRYCSMRLVDIAIRENDVVHTLVNTCLSLMTQVIQSLSQALFTLTHFKEDRQLLGVKAFIADVTKYIKLCVGQYGLRQTNHLTVRGIGRQDVGSYGSDVLCQAHHQLLADRVDGRVRHLRKLLTEVVEQHLWTV